jgi:hypothetical protein
VSPSFFCSAASSAVAHADRVARAWQQQRSQLVMMPVCCAVGSSGRPGTADPRRYPGARAERMSCHGSWNGFGVLLLSNPLMSHQHHCRGCIPCIDVAASVSVPNSMCFPHHTVHSTRTASWFDHTLLSGNSLRSSLLDARSHTKQRYSAQLVHDGRRRCFRPG